MKRFTNILLVIQEGSDHIAAVKRAIALAQQNRASLTVCSVLDIDPTDLSSNVLNQSQLRDIALADGQEALDRLARIAAQDGVLVETRTLIGTPFAEIIRHVLRDGSDLVVKNAEGGGRLSDFLFGSTDMHLIRKCPCPVWIIKSTEQHQYGRILAAIDQDSEDAVKHALNLQILEMSSSMAATEGSELHVVHAWKLLGESMYRSLRSGLPSSEVDAMVSEESSRRKKWLESVVGAYADCPGRQGTGCGETELHAIEGDPKFVIPAMAKELEVDLVVMGSVARTGIPGFLIGNTAEGILNRLDCSVLTVKPPGFVSPITAEA